MAHEAASSRTRLQVAAALSRLVGLRLAAAGRAADMRTFDFGGTGRAAAFALHVQCPWRVDGPGGIVTGRADLFEPLEPDPDFDRAGWDYDRSPNLQDARVGGLLAGGGPPLVVTGVAADDHGGAVIALGYGYALRLFPAGTTREDWRLFRPGADAPHFVVSAGEVEPEDDEDEDDDADE